MKKIILRLLPLVAYLVFSGLWSHYMDSFDIVQMVELTALMVLAGVYVVLITRKENREKGD